jgi:hypothetical protein
MMVRHIRLDRRQFYLFEGLGINSLPGVCRLGRHDPRGAVADPGRPRTRSGPSRHRTHVEIGRREGPVPGPLINRLAVSLTASRATDLRRRLRVAQRSSSESFSPVKSLRVACGLYIRTIPSDSGVLLSSRVQEFCS